MASFLDLDELGEDDRLLRSEVHRFAAEVLRPASMELDRMSAEERVKPGSPYFRVLREMRRLGYHRLHLPESKGGPGFTPLQRYIVMEELGWGSLGLATAIGVDSIPFTLAALLGSKELYKELVEPWLEDYEVKYHGCWGVTEPAHGSDYLIALREDRSLVERFGRADVVAERSGDGWVISGQKSSWVSAAPVATHCALHAQLKHAHSFTDQLLCVVSLDAKGVAKGRPVEMVGMRECPQGALFFDQVYVPDSHVLVAPGPFYKVFLDQLLVLTSVGLAAYSVGAARACFEEALNYARARVQGGVPLVKHKNIKLRLYEMYEKVESARYYVRKAMEYAHRRIIEGQSFDVPPRLARMAQVYAKKAAYQVAESAQQVFGAYGLSREFLVEKLFRDTRSLLVADGTLDVLSLEASEDIIQNYEKDYYDVGQLQG